MIKIFAGLFFLYNVIFWILGGLIHLWTVYISFSMAGIFGGIVAFFFPVISEIYTGYGAWKYDGFNSPYIQWLIVLLVMWLFRYVLIFILASFENKVEKQL
jgi:hypothetical protein